MAAQLYENDQSIYDEFIEKEHRLPAQKTILAEDSHKIIHLPDALVSMLKVMKLENGGDNMLFRNRRGEMLRDNSVRSAFNAAFIALGLPWRGTHICRHTWGTSGLKANDDNISKVQVNMGHSDRRVSEIYAKAQAQADRSTTENTARLMGFK